MRISRSRGTAPVSLGSAKVGEATQGRRFPLSTRPLATL